ncbi:MAG: hypothetical protein ACYCTB_10390 [bacterium]
MKQINKIILAVHKILLEILTLSGESLSKSKKLIIFFAFIMLFSFSLSGCAKHPRRVVVRPKVVVRPNIVVRPRRVIRPKVVIRPRRSN